MAELNLDEALGDRRRYERQIDRLHSKHLLTRQMYELQQDGVSLARVVQNRTRAARVLASTVARGRYLSAPAQLRTMSINGKMRTILAYRLTDLIVHGVVADVIEEAMRPILSPRLYSYRKGVSWWIAVQEFAAYVRAHRRSRPDPRTRGIHVIRRDIHAYADTIPVGPDSRIWRMLRDILRPSSSSPPIVPSDWELVERVVRPELFVDGERTRMVLGVATGQPIACALFNLYLCQLDSELDRVPGGFYGRYSDDILFAHPDPAVAQWADARIQEVVSGLQLELNTAKSRDLFLNAAGRPYEGTQGVLGSTVVPFLGTHVRADGTVSLSAEAMRDLLRDLSRRASRTARAMGDAEPERIGQTVCSVINRALDPNAPIFQQQWSAAVVRRAVTDRSQLAQIDYLIARIVIRAVTGEPGVRAFRRIPYSKLRQDWRLRSVVHARNRWARSREGAGGGRRQ